MSFRRVRRWLTGQAMLAGRRAAPLLPEPAISACQFALARMGLHAPVLRGLVAKNMRVAGVYSDETIRDYFEQVALHLANALRVFRFMNRSGAVGELAREQIDVDASISILESARLTGRGVLLAPAHTVNFVLTLARLNQEVPICIFLRWSEDAGKLRLKREWCEACGLRVVMEPAGSLSATTRAAICVEALRAGEVLAITPDVAQKASEGTAVRIFDRTAYLPTGAAAIAKLAESPIVPLFGRLEGGKQVLYAEPPLFVETLSREQGGRKAAMQQTMQKWAGGFEAFVRRSPACWFLWGDSRWTRVFRGDPKYVGTGGPGDRGTRGSALP